MSAIPSRLIPVTLDPDDKCGICLDGEKEKDKTFAHEGGLTHIFHLPCLKDWDKTLVGRGAALTCPACKKALDISPALSQLEKIQNKAQNILRGIHYVRKKSVSVAKNNPFTTFCALTMLGGFFGRASYISSAINGAFASMAICTGFMALDDLKELVGLIGDPGIAALASNIAAIIVTKTLGTNTQTIEVDYTGILLTTAIITGIAAHQFCMGKKDFIMGGIAGSSVGSVAILAGMRNTTEIGALATTAGAIAGLATKELYTQWRQEENEEFVRNRWLGFLFSSVINWGGLGAVIGLIEHALLEGGHALWEMASKS